MRITKRSILLAGCGIAALAMPAHAQDNAEEEDVIVVTAQNRAQDVTDVPIAIDVVGGEELANEGFTDANDLSQIAPAVQVIQDQGTVKITLRGIGTTSNDEAQDTSVVANIDGEYINRPNVLGVAIFDLERVEVLRGPQGTLYGRNSTAGAINFITRKPGDELGANVSLSLGNYSALRVDAGVDVPLADGLGLRVAGFKDSRDGYVDHPAGYGFGPFPRFGGGQSDDNSSYGGRATLAFDDGGPFSANIQFEYADRQFTPQAFAAADLNSGGRAPAGPGCNRDGYTRVATAYAQTLCVPNQTTFLETLDRSEYASPGFGLGRIGDETWALRGRIAYEFSDAATLSYIAGYRDFSEDTGTFVTLPVSYRSFNWLGEAQTQSHELRLNGDISGIIYQVGGFYFKEEQQSESGFFVPIGANGTYLSYFGRDVSSDSLSAFGQVEVPLGDTLTAVGGIRYTDNSRSAIYDNASPFGAGPPDAGLFNAGPSRKTFSTLRYATRLNLGSDDDKITWLAGLNWQPNADTLIYAKVSTGFKGGGFDSVGTYDPESNTAYEAGAKLTFGPNGNFQFNLGGFYYDYTGLQVSVLLDTTVGGQTFNAGAATIWGLEAEGVFDFEQGTTIDFAVNYLNATYDELFAQFNVYTVPGTGTDVNGVGDLDPTTAGVQQPNFAGNTAPFSPEWVIRAGIQHELDLGSAGSLTAGASTTYKSSYFTDFYNYNDGRQVAFFQTDLSLQWRDPGDRAGVQLFVRNLENNRPLTYGSFVSAGPDDIFNWQFGTPRTVGIRFSLDY
ncbi:TonB-dependent receptor [Alteraurantiacibacter buctensis]|uniref:TonB-dependent receptor n=1 Tax=Alteraurantiacibacter buctensis TaxID=1503981 RepID=A0A844YWI4_9SPHN|nr:TonB-dependent receptor [Alteraurantiacibacter buctensis]MXO71919.1 TonB-dependent receptor [Alteraurantiacibacter buctensis]